MRSITATLTVALAVTALPAAAATVENLRDFEVDATELSVRNLAGQVEIVPSRDDIFRVQTVSVGTARDGVKAQAVADRLDFQLQGNRLTARFPVDEVSTFKYSGPEYGTMSIRTKYLGRRVRVRRGGSGLDLHARIRVQAPAGSTVRLVNHVGSVVVTNVDARLDLETDVARISVTDSSGMVRADTGSASVEIAGFRGDVVADAGSGSVVLENILGEVRADTGSGSVEMRGVDGNVVADTGSGRVRMTDIVADRMRVDTGSGSVTLEDVSGSLEADTGSGRLRARGYTAGPDVRVSTGSGSLTLEGNLVAAKRLRLRAGSGSVTVRSSELPGMSLIIDTGSGGIRVDAPMSGITTDRRDRFEADTGGEAYWTIDTGSGSVTLDQLGPRSAASSSDD